MGDGGGLGAPGGVLGQSLSDDAAGGDSHAGGRSSTSVGEGGDSAGGHGGDSSSNGETHGDWNVDNNREMFLKIMGCR